MLAMPNIASAFNSEISRVARKEVRAETQTLAKAASTHRTEIAALKRRVLALEKALRHLAKQAARSAPEKPSEASPEKLRFVAKGFASTRRRLGLSAEDVGLLIGASGQSVYNWERGEARPRTKHLAAIAALRTMGKKAAATRLAELREAT